MPSGTGTVQMSPQTQPWPPRDARVRLARYAVEIAAVAIAYFVAGQIWPGARLAASEREPDLAADRLCARRSCCCADTADMAGDLSRRPSSPTQPPPARSRHRPRSPPATRSKRSSAPQLIDLVVGRTRDFRDAGQMSRRFALICLAAAAPVSATIGVLHPVPCRVCRMGAFRRDLDHVVARRSRGRAGPHAGHRAVGGERRIREPERIAGSRPRS